MTANSELDKVYDPSELEGKWYAYWLAQKFFEATPNSEKEPYTIVIPPPNVTGILHMGHMLNNTIQDVLVRKARMQGKNACWVAGTDHASIATEAKVVAMLAEKGIDKKNLSREEFLTHAWAWKEKYGGIILEQLKKLGCSCDWSRTRFTMEEDMSKAVIDAFVHLYNKNLIYRGIRMVNWDPKGKTAISDEEVIFETRNAKLYFIQYPFTEGEGSIIVATVRPETIMGDVAICVNPNDERYKSIVGKKVRIPILNKEIPIIADAYVDAEFGTGALKITPAHDKNDYEIGLKFNLEVIDVLDENGNLSEKCGIPKYVGKDRFAVRKDITKELEELGFIQKIEEYQTQIGTSERTGTVIEPKLSVQWFLKMKDLAQPALDAVETGEIKLYPPKFNNTYRIWLENVKDWCLSRQLWWGQRIPAYYLPNNEIVVADTPEKALALAQEKNANYTQNDLRQDEDVLDTWASSWLWPISVFDGFKPAEETENHKDFNYFYPTNDLVTAPEILFFWVARMIMAGYEFKGKKPFENVYLTGIVRDKLGRKMSKSLGNSPDPIELMKQYSTDGVRVGMLFSSPAGNDLRFDEKLCEQGRNFANKIWNSFRLVKMWNVADENTEKTISNAQKQRGEIAINWFKVKFQQTLQELTHLYQEYRISDVLVTVYKLYWDDFCAYYLEAVKPESMETQLVDKHTYAETLNILEDLLKILHPFMPFITEELWQNIRPRKEGESICIADYPVLNEEILAKNTKENFAEKGKIAFELVTEIRNARNSKGISPKVTLKLTLKNAENNLENIYFNDFLGIIKKLTNVEILFADEKPKQAQSLMAGNQECYLELGIMVNVEQERQNIQKELDNLHKFKMRILGNLQNEKFIQNAKPEIIEAERKKLTENETKIVALEESLKSL